MKKYQALKINNTVYYFIGFDRMKYQGRRCIILATDPTNKNTYGRYTHNFLNNMEV